jgi:hypothetical protein
MASGEPAMPLDADALLKPIKRVYRKVPARTTRAPEVGGQPHFFSPKQKLFLDTYSATLDVKKALEESKMRLQDVEKSDYLMAEVGYINQNAAFAHRNKAALGTHLRLMTKFEKDYDKSFKQADRNSLANTLARMSEANLRVAGEYSEAGDGGAVSGVQVVLNIGGAVTSVEEVAHGS